MKLVQWTSSATPTGVSGAPTQATAAKGQVLVDACARNLVEFAREFRVMEKGKRVDHRAVKPNLPTLPNHD